MPQSLRIQSNEIFVMHNNTSVQAGGEWLAVTLWVWLIPSSPQQRASPAQPPLWGDQKIPEQTAQVQMQEQIFAVILDNFFCWLRAQPQDHWYILSNGYCENFLIYSFVLKIFRGSCTIEKILLSGSGNVSDWLVKNNCLHFVNRNLWEKQKIRLQGCL